VSYLEVPVRTTLSDLEGHFNFETFLSHLRNTVCNEKNGRCLHTNRKTYEACNFSCLIETGWLLKITGCHAHRKSGNISEMVQDRDVVTTLCSKKTGPPFSWW